MKKNKFKLQKSELSTLQYFHNTKTFEKTQKKKLEKLLKFLKKLLSNYQSL